MGQKIHVNYLEIGDEYNGKDIYVHHGYYGGNIYAALLELMPENDKQQTLSEFGKLGRTFESLDFNREGVADICLMKINGEHYGCVLVNDDYTNLHCEKGIQIKDIYGHQAIEGFAYLTKRILSFQEYIENLTKINYESLDIPRKGFVEMLAKKVDELNVLSFDEDIYRFFEICSTTYYHSIKDKEVEE